MDLREGRFVATPEKGEVSYLLLRPPQAEWCLVLGHGASRPRPVNQRDKVLFATGTVGGKVGGKDATGGKVAAALPLAAKLPLVA